MVSGLRRIYAFTVCVRDDDRKTFEFRATNDSADVTHAVVAAVARGRRGSAATRLRRMRRRRTGRKSSSPRRGTHRSRWTRRTLPRAQQAELDRRPTTSFRAMLGESMKERQTCVGCGRRSPETETNYTLISAQSGWRLTRRPAADGTVNVEWRRPPRWRAHRAGDG